MKIGALIPVRLGSERFPKKHLQEVQGISILQHLLNRLFTSTYLIPENVIVCTTLQPEDDPLVALVKKTGANLFRGDKADLINRLYFARAAYQLDIIAEIDGDDPCVDIIYLDRCITELLKDKTLDIVTPTELPLGLACKVFTKKAFQTVYEAYCTTQNDTGFMWYFTKTGLCKQLDIPAELDERHVDARLTLDYPEDLLFFRQLFDKLYHPDKVFNAKEIVNLFKQDPTIVKINSFLNKTYQLRTKQLAKLHFKHQGKIQTVECE